MTTSAKNVAVIGCGYWGKNLVRNMAELGALAAVCDAHAPSAEAQSKQHHVPVRSIAEVMADAAITGVVIAAPAAQHAALAAQALDAGKHVFVEKPLALTVADAEALETLAKEKNRTLMVGHLLQYHPAYLKLKEMVEAGELGVLSYVYSNRLSLGKFRTEENVLWSFAPHDISMVLGLFGEAPVSVSAQGTTQITAGIPDVVTAQFTFASGAKGHVFVSWLHPVKEQKLIVIGEKAMAVFDDTLPMEQKLQLFRHKVEWNGTIPAPVKADAELIPLPIGASSAKNRHIDVDFSSRRLGGGLPEAGASIGDTEHISAPLPASPLRGEELSSEPLKNECQHFLNAMAGKTQPRTDAAEGIRVLKVLEAAEQSMSTGAQVNLNSNAPAGVYVHPTAIVDKGCSIGTGTKIWHFSHILGGTKIGENCVIAQNVMIGPDVTVGNRCKIQNNVSLYKGVQLADGVFCGPSCVFTNVNTPRSEIERKDEYLPTPVGRAATIGANATIICGNTLGAYCLIGAGAVVTKDVKPHALMVGNPARQIGWVSHAGERLDAELVCPREGRTYRVNANEELEEIIKESTDARVA